MREVTSVAEDVIQSVRTLLLIFLESKTQDIERDEYLVRTGAVHDLITKARAPGGVSADNLASVRKKWKQDNEAMDDGLNEINEMIQDTRASGSDESFEDDGWDELGFESSQTMDQTELERAKKVSYHL
jgi:Grap2 and cyclin-D-interacting